MYVQVCPAASFDTVTHTCSAPEWALQVGILPPLSIGDGLAIGGAILGLWAVAYTLRAIRNTVSVR